MINDCLYSSRSEDWATPQHIFDQLNEEFHFTLDVCADDSNHKCERYFTKTDDGLLQDWTGEVCFCNPPYGKEIYKWVQKAASANTTVVMLVPSRTDTAWFHDWVYGIAEIRFIRGRLKYGGSENKAPFPSLIAVFRGEQDAYTVST